MKIIHIQKLLDSYSVFSVGVKSINCIDGTFNLLKSFLSIYLFNSFSLLGSILKGVAIHSMLDILGRWEQHGRQILYEFFYENHDEKAMKKTS